MNTKTGLVILPPELIRHVVASVPPAYHLDFALSCRTIFTNVVDTLTHHRECHDSHQTYFGGTADRVAETLLNFAKDPVSAWHMRTFDIRNDVEAAPDASGSSISQVDVDKTDGITLKRDGSGNGTHEEDCGLRGEQSGCYSQVQLGTIRSAVRRAIRNSTIDGTNLLLQLEKGGLEVLTIATLLLCPRVRTLKITQFPVQFNAEAEEASITTSQDVLTDSVPTYDSMLAHIIKATSGNSNAIWPPYFLSIRNVAVGYDNSNTEFSVHPVHVTPLFLLPNIQSVCIRGLDVANNHMPMGADRRADFALRPGSSTVSHVFLDSSEPDKDEWNLQTFVVGAPSLRSIIFNECCIEDLDSISRLLKEYHRESLEVFIPERDDLLTGYRFRMHVADQTSEMENLSTFQIDMMTIREYTL